MKSILSICLLLLAFVVTGQHYKEGDKVNIEWQGKWFSGKIITEKPEGYLISYDGYGNEWNEVVPLSRLKPILEENNSATNSSQSLSTISSTSYKGVETIWDIQITKDDKYIIAANAYGKITVLNATDLTLVTEINTGKSPVFSAAMSNDGNYLIAGTGDGKLCIYSRTEGMQFSEYTIIKDYFSIEKIRIAPNGDLYVSGAPASNYKDIIVDVWNIAEKKKIRTLLKSTVSEHVISDMTFTADGTKIALAISNNKKGIEVYETATGKQAYKISTKFDVSTVSFSADGKFIASGGIDRKVTLWNTSNKTMVWSSVWKNESEDYVNSVQISPNGLTIAVCGRGTGAPIKIYDFVSGKVFHEIGKTNPVGNAIRYSSNSKIVYVAYTTYGDFAKVPIVYMTVIPSK